jgi:hypothetical protein
VLCLRVDSVPEELTEHERQAVVEDMIMQAEAMSPLTEIGTV